MGIQLPTLIGTAVVIYLGIFLLNTNLQDDGNVALAQHIKKYSFHSEGVAIQPFEKMEDSEMNFAMATNEVNVSENSSIYFVIENGSLLIGSSYTVTKYTFIVDTWQGEITGDGSSWYVNGKIGDATGSEFGLVLSGEKIEDTERGVLYQVHGQIDVEDNVKYTLHHFGTINERR